MPRYLGVDFGERRIGLAISDEDGLMAIPLGVLRVNGIRQAAGDVAKVCREKKVSEVVVGMPLNMDGSRGASSERVDSFVQTLARECALPVKTWDERLSSRLVERMLLESDITRSRRKDLSDKLAAQVILQSYLDACSRTTRKGGFGEK